MRERSAPRSSLDESGSSRKSSISSGRKKFISGGKEFAVTLFVNEADKNKILEMLHRAKCVISKKVEKVMGRKTTKAEISDTDALKTVLQNWVEEEEIKSVQVTAPNPERLIFFMLALVSVHLFPLLYFIIFLFIQTIFNSICPKICSKNCLLCKSQLSLK